MKEEIAKLEIIKELTQEPSVKQVCDVLIDVLNKLKDKKKFGFTNED